MEAVPAVGRTRRGLFVRLHGVAPGLAVDGDGVVGAVVGVEAQQGVVELVGVDAHQDVADDELAGHLVVAAAAPAAEPLAGKRRQVGGPLGHGLVAGQGTHGVGGEHAFGTSVSVNGMQRGARQARTRPAEKPASATQSPRRIAAYHGVSPIFGSATR